MTTSRNAVVDEGISFPVITTVVIDRSLPRLSLSTSIADIALLLLLAKDFHDLVLVLGECIVRQRVGRGQGSVAP